MSHQAISDKNLRLALETGFSEAEAQSLWRSFCHFDADNSGAIEASEFASVLRLFGVDCTDAAVNEIMAESDISSDGVVSFQEFCSAARKRHKAKAERQADLRAAFQHFDQDNTGQLSRDQLVLALTSLGEEPLDADQVEAIMKLGDRDGSGDLSIEEFVRCLTQDFEEMLMETANENGAEN